MLLRVSVDCSCLSVIIFSPYMVHSKHQTIPQKKAHLHVRIPQDLLEPIPQPLHLPLMNILRARPEIYQKRLAFPDELLEISCHH